MRRFLLLGLIQQESIIKTLIFCDFTISPLLSFWPIFLYTVLTPGCERYVMQQYLTYMNLCNDINETGPSLVIFLRVDQFYVLRFLFCRVYVLSKHEINITFLSFYLKVNILTDFQIHWILQRHVCVMSTFYT